jgi:hypothetical protein
MTYDAFRTGWTYTDVYATFWRSEANPSQWHPKRRNSVLGRWREIKLRLWAEHLEQCQPFEQVIDMTIEEY